MTSSRVVESLRDLGQALRHDRHVRIRFGASPDLDLSVRTFSVEEGISQLFAIRLTCVSPYAEIDLSSLVGDQASFELSWNVGRRWSGLCDTAEFARVADDGQGLATYELTVVPMMWRLTQRVQNRLFQHVSIPEIVTAILQEWQIDHTWTIAREKYPAMELRTQYAETDFAFVSRLLEEAGISYSFSDQDEAPSRLILCDEPQHAETREGPPLLFADDVAAGYTTNGALIGNVRLKESSKPGRFTFRDHDFMRPRQALFSHAEPSRETERAHEQYRFSPGVGGAEHPKREDLKGVFPAADSLGVARWHGEQAALRVQRAQEAAHSERRLIMYDINISDLSPGVVFCIGRHPRADLSGGRRLLAIRHTITGEVASRDPFVFTGIAVDANAPFRAPQITPKPRIHGLQTAVVVGPHLSRETVSPLDTALRGAVGRLSAVALEGGSAPEVLRDKTIHVDEHGRVRVQFPWDREHAFNDQSSVWTRVSQGWAGAGYGFFAIPRVGHEVLIAFLDGDPDCPMIVGRAHNAAEPPPHPLPASKTVSTWKSASSPSGDGFNELRFDDASSSEHVYLQAQKDMDHLVKNNLKQAVGGESTRFVQSHDTHAVGGSRSDFVNVSHANAVGVNQANFVGMHRTNQIGIEDHTMVGTRWAVTVARGMTSQLVGDLEQIASSVGQVLRGKAETVFGRVPATPLAEASTSVLAGLGAALFDGLKSLVETTSTVGRKMEAGGPAPTAIEMVDRQIRLSTGEASIVLDGPNITMMAQGNIVLHAMDHISVLSENEIAIGGRQKVALVSAESDVIVQAKRDLHLNPYDAAGDSLPPAGSPAAAPIAGVRRLRRARPIVRPEPSDVLPDHCAICGSELSSTEPWARSCSAVEAMEPVHGVVGDGEGLAHSYELAGRMSDVLSIAQTYGMRGDIIQHGMKAITEGVGLLSPSYTRTLRWLAEFRHLNPRDLARLQTLRIEDAPHFVGFSMASWVKGAPEPSVSSMSFGGPNLEAVAMPLTGYLEFAVHLPGQIKANFHNGAALEAVLGLMQMDTVTHV